MRGFQYLAGAVLGAALLWAASGCGSRPAAPPARVIWIVIDSLRADHLGFMGYGRPTSPNLDGLARQSVVFSRAYASANNTRSSVASYMSGKFYSQLHEGSEQGGLPDAAISIAETFQQAGFRTTGVTTNFNLRPAMGHAQGFDVYEKVYMANSPRGDLGEIIEVLRRGYKRGAGREFVYIHTMDVHHPYRPPIPYGTAFTPGYDRAVVREGNIYNLDDSLVIGVQPYFAENQDITDADKAFLTGLYDGTIAYTDARLPELLDVLGYDPARDMLVITADHGEQFFEHGFWRHGWTLTPPEIHVPLLIRYDGFTPSVHRGPVSLLDLYPTFCDLFSLPRPEGLMGVSLAPALHGGTLGTRTVSCETPDSVGPAAAIIGPQYLYSVCADVRELRPWRVWPFEEALYDLQEDAQAQHNLAGERPDMARMLNEELRRIHPRWSEYTHEILQGGDDTVSFGPNLLTEPDLASTISPGLSVEHTETGALRLDAPERELRYRAAIDAPGGAYAVDVRWQLASGSARFELWEDGGGLLWSYPVRKASSDWKEVRGVVYTAAPAVELRIRLDQPARLEAGPMTLRRVLLPPLPKPLAVHAAAPAAASLTDEEKQRLETIGYLGQ